MYLVISSLRLLQLLLSDCLTSFWSCCCQDPFLFACLVQSSPYIRSEWLKLAQKLTLVKVLYQFPIGQKIFLQPFIFSPSSEVDAWSWLKFGLSLPYDWWMLRWILPVVLFKGVLTCYNSKFQDNQILKFFSLNNYCL